MLKSTWLLSAAVLSVAAPVFGQATAQSNTDADKSGAQATQGATSDAAAVQDKAREQQPVDTSDIIVTATHRRRRPAPTAR